MLIRALTPERSKGVSPIRVGEKDLPDPDRARIAVVEFHHHSSVVDAHLQNSGTKRHQAPAKIRSSLRSALGAD
jgi:hypothetical protein